MLRPRDLPLLHDFLVVCEQGNLTRAAENLGTVQSGITQKIKRLEDALGTRLLVRHSRGVEPTEQGQILARYARRIVNMLEGATTEIEAWEGSPSGSISVGLPPSVAVVLTTPLIETIGAEMPRVELTIAEAFSGYLWSWLESGEIDFAFVFDMPATKDIAVTPLVQEDLFLVAPPEKRAELPEVLTIKDLDGLPLITPSRRHKLRTDVESAALQDGVHLNIRLEVDAGHQLIRQVMHGTGYSILARSAVIPELNEGRLVAIPMRAPRFTRRVCLAERHDRQSAFLRGRVHEVIRKVVRVLVESGDWPGELVGTASVSVGNQ